MGQNSDDMMDSMHSDFNISYVGYTPERGKLSRRTTKKFTGFSGKAAESITRSGSLYSPNESVAGAVTDKDASKLAMDDEEYVLSETDIAWLKQKGWKPPKSDYL